MSGNLISSGFLRILIVPHKNTEIMDRYSKSFLDMEEHRQFERVSADFKIWAHNTTRFAGGGVESPDTLGVPCRFSDLSFCGAKILGSVPLGSPADQLEISFPVVGDRTISLIGTMVRSEQDSGGFYTAVRFTRISVDDQWRLSQVLSELGEATIGQFQSAPLSPMRKPHNTSAKRASFKRR